MSEHPGPRPSEAEHFTGSYEEGEILEQPERPTAEQAAAFFGLDKDSSEYRAFVKAYERGTPVVASWIKGEGLHLRVPQKGRMTAFAGSGPEPASAFDEDVQWEQTRTRGFYPPSLGENIARATTSLDGIEESGGFGLGDLYAANDLFKLVRISDDPTGRLAVTVIVPSAFDRQSAEEVIDRIPNDLLKDAGKGENSEERATDVRERLKEVMNGDPKNLALDRLEVVDEPEPFPYDAVDAILAERVTEERSEADQMDEIAESRDDVAETPAAEPEHGTSSTPELPNIAATESARKDDELVEVEPDLSQWVDAGEPNARIDTPVESIPVDAVDAQGEGSSKGTIEVTVGPKPEATDDATTPEAPEKEDGRFQRFMQRIRQGARDAGDYFGVTESSYVETASETTPVDELLHDDPEDNTERPVKQSRLGALKERFTNPETGRFYSLNGMIGGAAFLATERFKDFVKASERPKVENLLESKESRRLKSFGRYAVMATVSGAALFVASRGIDMDISGMSDLIPDFSGFGGEAPAVNQLPTSEASPSPEIAEPTLPEPTTEAEGPEERPLNANELLEQHGADADAARTIEAGEGVDNTLREMGIEDAGLRQELATDPELRDTLVDRGVAYEAGDTIGWNEAGELDDQTIEDIYERAAELSGEEIPATPEAQETPEEVPLNEAPEPPSEIERAQAEAFTDALDTLEANSAETFESLNIPQGGGGEQLLQAINREFWPNGVMAIDQSAWYGIEDQLARDYPQDFYRMADGHVGLMRPGYISEQAKNGLVEILRARGYANLVG